MTDYFERSLQRHRETQGKVEVRSRMRLESMDDLSIAYTPGVARPCEVIGEDPASAWDLTLKGRTVAVVSDGSAILGLGDLGPMASLPVMEGKAALFREFGGIDAFPVVVAERDPEAIVRLVRGIAPTFGGINLEDISAPRCFQIEEELQDVGIPVLHDDQHGTAIVLLAALMNATYVHRASRSGGPLRRHQRGGSRGAGLSRVCWLVHGPGRALHPRGEACASAIRAGIIWHPGNDAQNESVKEQLAQDTNPGGEQGSAPATPCAERTRSSA